MFVWFLYYYCYYHYGEGEGRLCGERAAKRVREESWGGCEKKTKLRTKRTAVMEVSRCCYETYIRICWAMLQIGMAARMGFGGALK